MPRKPIKKLPPARMKDYMMGMLDNLQEAADHCYLPALLAHDKIQAKQHLLIRRSIETMRENLFNS